MSDNRLFLVHKPTMLGVMIGDMYDGYSWSDPNQESSIIQAFYDFIAEEDSSGTKNDFILFSEDDGSNIVYGEVTEDGWRQFIINNEKVL